MLIQLASGVLAGVGSPPFHRCWLEQSVTKGMFKGTICRIFAVKYPNTTKPMLYILFS